MNTDQLLLAVAIATGSFGLVVAVGAFGMFLVMLWFKRRK